MNVTEPRAQDLADKADRLVSIINGRDRDRFSARWSGDLAMLRAFDESTVQLRVEAADALIDASRAFRDEGDHGRALELAKASAHQQHIARSIMDRACAMQVRRMVTS